MPKPNWQDTETLRTYYSFLIRLVNNNQIKLWRAARGKTAKTNMNDGEPKEPSLFDEINSYLKRGAPEGIENPTVQGLAEQLGIPDDVLDNWIAQDRQFREEMTNLKEFQTKDPFNEGNSTDYFVHSSGILFVLDETKKRYSV